MNPFKILIIIFGMMLPVAIAFGINKNSSVVFQVNHSTMIFDSSTVESATVKVPENPKDAYAVSLKLKPAAANKIDVLTKNNIGK